MRDLVVVSRLSPVAESEGYSFLSPQALGCTGPSSYSTQVPAVAAHGLSCPAAMWNLPEPGIEPGAPALAGGFFTAGPPEKSLNPAF